MEGSPIDYLYNSILGMEDLSNFWPESHPEERSMKAALTNGMTKRVVVVHMPFDGNNMYVYDEYFREISSIIGLYHAQTVYFTNQKHRSNAPLRGWSLFDRTTIVKGWFGSSRSSLHISERMNQTSRTTTLSDEHSMWEFKTCDEWIPSEVRFCFKI